MNSPEMNGIYDLYKRRFKVNLEQFKDMVFQRSIGNYTKSYETYKRVENIVTCFKQEIKKDKIFKVLDAGCGDGYHIFLLNMLKEVKEKVSFDGVDISKLEIEFAQEVNNSFGFDNINFRVGDVEYLKFPQSSFDIILCNDVIEHLKKPDKCLSEIKKVCKPGGLVIITTPNKTNAIRMIFRRNISPKSNFKQEGGHISVKGLNEWLRIIRKEGFIVEDIKRGALIFGGPPYNCHPVLFAFVLIVDCILEFLPLGNHFSESITLKLRKPNDEKG